ncbi:unnamed protein product [Psylliodes chrysocephalus]|uniref:Uncharacterized protein n=1 Tax=Psylliodes chrysocephalus TaxID=3402493 RepID=A0A9P0CXV6_9CUCU|nr:unnamed protein product [Psylliodes chrysocephala]
MFNKMFVIRIVLVSCFSLVIFESVEAECTRDLKAIYCENIIKISSDVLNESYQYYLKLNILNTTEPFGKSAFKNMKKLTSISISRSRMGTIYSDTFKDMPPLKNVFIDFVIIGDIQESAFSNLPKLVEVSISNTDIPFLRKGIFRNVPQLSIITIESANLRYIQDDAFYDVPKLNSLRLYSNLLTVVTKGMLNTLTNLQYLNLANNSISIIENNSFDETPHLSYLILEGNQLKALDLDMFPTTGMKYLQFINLNGNRLMFLPSAFFNRTPALEEIGLSLNPWFCPCLKEIYGILYQYNIKESSIREMINYFHDILDGDTEKIILTRRSRLPICINRNVSDIICINTYSENLSKKYLKYIKDYETFL